MFGITVPATVTRVLDGDTIEVKIERTVRIRLLDCWAPETRTKDLDEKQRGLAAKKVLENMVMGREVVVEVPIEQQGKFGDAMSFGRVLGRVRCNGTDVSDAMVALHLATKTKEG